jgi:signal transduction histidine kinase
MALVALAAGAVWARISAHSRHRELTRPVVDLHRSSDVGGMRSVLVTLLNDPNLEIGYPVPDGGYVDADGHPLEAAPGEARAATRLTHAGLEVAVVMHRHGVLDDPHLVDEIASAAFLGLDNERLRAETRQQLADVRASRSRIIAAGDEERRQLERDLHDGAQQRVVGLALALRVLRNTTDKTGSSVLASAEERVHLALAELRDLARGIHRVILSEEGLAAALDALAESTQLWVRQCPAGRFPAQIETMAYQVVVTALNAGRVAVSVTATRDGLTVDAVSTDSTEALQDVHDRVDALGGQITVEAGADGSRLTVRLPLEIPSSEK